MGCSRVQPHVELKRTRGSVILCVCVCASSAGCRRVRWMLSKTSDRSAVLLCNEMQLLLLCCCKIVERPAGSLNAPSESVEKAVPLSQSTGLTQLGA